MEQKKETLENTLNNELEKFKNLERDLWKKVEIILQKKDLYEIINTTDFYLYNRQALFNLEKPFEKDKNGNNKNKIVILYDENNQIKDFKWFYFVAKGTKEFSEFSKYLDESGLTVIEYLNEKNNNILSYLKKYVDNTEAQF